MKSLDKVKLEEFYLFLYLKFIFKWELFTISYLYSVKVVTYRVGIFRK